MLKRPDFGKVISSVINNISEDRLLKRSLTYLMLTSKSESVLRDLLAFGLHEKLRATDYVIAREWYRTDIVVLARPFQKKDPKAIIELKMVAAPGNDDKTIHKHLRDLTSQLKNNEKRWPYAERFGLFMVRDLRETSLNSTSALDGKIIKGKRKSLRSNPTFYRSVKIGAKKFDLLLVNEKCLVCGKDEKFKARVNLMTWLFSPSMTVL